MTAGGSGPDQKSVLTRAVTNAAGRAGHEIDMAATILLLAGRGGTFYTGQILFPDGGKLSGRKVAGFQTDTRAGETLIEAASSN
jgi:NAD(P)-dependent dehydrogenase (short-subunit alcohol dehydrogenase family)